MTEQSRPEHTPAAASTGHRDPRVTANHTELVLPVTGPNHTDRPRGANLNHSELVLGTSFNHSELLLG